MPDQFLDTHHELIQCSLHGAKSNIEDGFCIFGPCWGQKLESLEIQIENDVLKLVTDY